jgi:hypothetical protein
MSLTWAVLWDTKAHALWTQKVKSAVWPFLYRIASPKRARNLTMLWFLVYRLSWWFSINFRATLHVYFVPQGLVNACVVQCIGSIPHDVIQDWFVITVNDGSVQKRFLQQQEGRSESFQWGSREVINTLIASSEPTTLFIYTVSIGSKTRCFTVYIKQSALIKNTRVFTIKNPKKIPQKLKKIKYIYIF